MSYAICLFFTAKQAGKDFTYLIVVLIGLGVTGELQVIYSILYVRTVYTTLT